MIDFSKLFVHYKYTKTMTIETRTAQHVIERWENKHIYEFMENKNIEFHLAPYYTYNGKHYVQITLDLDLGRVHKREGSTKKQLLKDIKYIINKLSHIPFHIEFTGNGYRVVSDVAWIDLDLDQARKIAMGKRDVIPSVDPVSSFRKMPIARIGTNDSYRTIIICSKRDAPNFDKYKAISKKAPNQIMSKDAWLQIFKAYWFPHSFRSTGGLKVVELLYSGG